MITLKKAIEILELNIKEAGSKMPPDCRDALQLGIEALYRCQEFRKYTTPKVYMPLPGETDDNHD